MTAPQPIDWPTTDIIAATGGRLLCGDPEGRCSGVGIDSRQLADQALFVAIVGAVHDGHRFVEAAVESGAAGVVIDHDHVDPMPLAAWRQARVICVAVDDTTRALGNLAAFHRARAGAAVVAITGSNGKTSTREMTAAVVSRKFQTLSTLKNFNNEIGLPLTLLRLAAGHQWAVVELGMNRPGEIRRLGQICCPEVGVITNIGPAHLEGVGSLDGVMAAKGELLETIAPNGTAVLNADDPRCLKLADQVDMDLLLYGFSENAQVRGISVREEGRGMVFTLVLPGETIHIRLAAPGRFMVSNALAAAAVGFRLGLPAAEIKAGLERFRPAEGRANIVDTHWGLHVIDDTYNANPGSMAAALSLLKSLGRDTRCVLAMGDMYELGPQAAALHREIGETAGRSGLFRIAATGAHAQAVADGARAGGMRSDAIFIGSRTEILMDFKQQLRPGDWVLVKGSRAMGMEKIVNELVARAGGPVPEKD